MTPGFDVGDRQIWLLKWHGRPLTACMGRIQLGGVIQDCSAKTFESLHLAAVEEVWFTSTGCREAQPGRGRRWRQQQQQHTLTRKPQPNSGTHKTSGHMLYLFLTFTPPHCNPPTHMDQAAVLLVRTHLQSEYVFTESFPKAIYSVPFGMSSSPLLNESQTCGRVSI